MAVAPAVPHTLGSWRLIYFDAPNRGEQVRQLFFLAGVAFADVRVHPYPQGLDPYRKAAMGDASPLLGTDQCPAVTAPDGTHCVETADIMRFVGQRIGLAPPADSAADATAVEMCLLAQECMDACFYGLLKQMVVRRIFRGEFCGALYWTRSLLIGKEAEYMVKPTAKLHEVMTRVEQTLQASGGPFVCGADMSFADVSLFAILHEVLEYECFDRSALLARHPKLESLMTTLEARTRPWIEQRVREHQMGIANTVDFFAAANTPFPWSKKTKQYT